MTEKRSNGFTLDALRPPQMEPPVVGSRDVMTIFGFDYRPLVIERLRRHGVNASKQELRFLDTGLRQKGSQELCFLEQVVGEHRVFLSYLGPNSTTTRHFHTYPVEELYEALAGKTFLTICQVTHELNTENGAVVVPPGEPHHLKTGENPALILSIMRDKLPIPPSDFKLLELD